jgi:hypothetical protein
MISLSCGKLTEATFCRMACIVFSSLYAAITIDMSTCSPLIRRIEVTAGASGMKIRKNCDWNVINRLFDGFVIFFSRAISEDDKLFPDNYSKRDFLSK